MTVTLAQSLKPILRESLCLYLWFENNHVIKSFIKMVCMIQFRGVTHKRTQSGGQVIGRLRSRDLVNYLHAVLDLSFRGPSIFHLTVALDMQPVFEFDVKMFGFVKIRKGQQIIRPTQTQSEVP